MCPILEPYKVYDQAILVAQTLFVQANSVDFLSWLI